jgi:transposase
MTLWHNDVLEGEIAKRLGCSIKIVRDAVVAWHAERNLPVPDGRTRRKQIRLRRGA